MSSVKKDKHYSFSPEARDLWGNVYPDLTEARDGIAGAMVGRSEAHVMRLSLIYCLFRGGDQIEVEDLKAALAFWKYADQSASYIFRGAAVPDRKKQKILECIGDGNKSKTEIRRDAFSGHIESELLDLLLNDLVETQVLVSELRQTGGAPATIYKKKTCVISAISSESNDLQQLTMTEELNALKAHKTPAELIHEKNRHCLNAPPPAIPTEVMS